MFILHTSNKAENLLAHLAAVFKAQPLSTPFQTELFLIQSQGMERWLSQQLANHFTVWGNSEFLFPNQFFNRLAQGLGSSLNSDLFSRDALLWRLLHLLRDTEGIELQALQHYLKGENPALKHFQLAQQLAQVYDQYQMMRPDMLAAWSQGQQVTDHDSESWQKTLWIRLLEPLGNEHRGILWQQAIGKLEQAEAGHLQALLPERVSIIGVNTMPPLFLQFLHSLSRHIPVHLYLLSPCSDYWLDLESKRQIAKKNLQRVTDGQEETPLFEDESPSPSPLLVTLGQHGRIFQSMLLEQVAFELELESFEDEDVQTLSNLQQLQHDILHNNGSGTQLQADGSISLHACHSRMREVEVLKDQVLRLLNDKPSLNLRDIVVMSPDIQVYAPFISAVFDNIQHAIADHTLRSSSQILDIFANFLRLSQSRFGWQAVIDLLEQPSIYPAFDLSETDLDLIRHWVSETHIRWGQSAEHRASLDLPALDENTWQAGMDRLLMGYSIGDEDGFVDDIFPFAAIEGSSTQALGGLNDYLQLLFKASNELQQPCSLKQRAEQLFDYADQLFSADDAEASADRQTLNELLSTLADNYADFYHDPVELEIIIAWLESAISERHTSTGFLRGQITFCSMLPMRSIPFKVIALLGMNESDFPKVDRPATFDLLAQHYRKGDRSRRNDDRYQFLETLLSARENLIITYIGQSIQKNESIPPSVVISELLDVLTGQYGLTEPVTEHRLQPFSYAYFDDLNHRLFSYSANDCKIAETLSQPAVSNASPWWHQPLATEPEVIIDLVDLFAFFRNPHKHFVQQQLAVYLHSGVTEAEERESFNLASLEDYTFNQAWVEAILSGQSYADDKIFTAQGGWLSGTPGQLLFARKQADLTPFIETILSKSMGDKQADHAVDITLGNYRLIGKLSHQYSEGSLIYRYTPLKGKDFITAWLHHLLMQQSQLNTGTWLIGKDEALFFEAAAKKDHKGISKPLNRLIQIYLQGQQQPSYFFVEPALAYIKQVMLQKTSKRAKKPPIDCARDKLMTALDNGYEPEMALLYRGSETMDNLLGKPFETLCSELEPVWSEAIYSSSSMNASSSKNSSSSNGGLPS